MCHLVPHVVIETSSTAGGLWCSGSCCGGWWAKSGWDGSLVLIAIILLNKKVKGLQERGL